MKYQRDLRTLRAGCLRLLSNLSLLAFIILIFSVAFAQAGEGTFQMEKKQEEEAPPAQYALAELFAYASKRYNVPIGLMFAISEVESRLNPWAVNVEGKSFYPKSKEEALRIIGENTGKSYDLGIMQINVQWLRKYKISPDNAITPPVNIILAAYILNENLVAHGPTWKAVAAYHIPPAKNPSRAIEYAKKVWASYRKRLQAESQVSQLRPN